MSNQDERERKEMMSLFKDPKFSRKAWQAVGQSILLQPCRQLSLPPTKEGDESISTVIENYSYNTLKKDVSSLGKENREPTELEMIMQCQIVKARYDTGAAIFVRDTLGARPVDESKIDQSVTNVYEDMTDEELEVLRKYREAKTAVPVEPTEIAAPEQICIDDCDT